ncbi:glycosyl transferase family 1 [Arcticibacter pallidicorallinus]|uniref:Glycosyl transferase family 1 n=1 Tax=Arcticibacter pallidicorallinus TaxID=1259464 RepID=A0A2T0UBK1_9SPHI|nr:glycosyltransferase family 4 protein [Arcticibacter pallidicorallinus]PRY55293.1 glycosyl transferase family 1 [Arcticibacter pallidicorallinus]
MVNKQIYSITTNLSRYGGAQKVLLDLHNGIKGVFDCKIIGFQSFDELHPKYKIERSDYLQLKNPFVLNGKIIIVHARNVMSFLAVLKKVFFLDTQIVYVSHNVYDNHRRITFLPDIVVSISKKVTDNLVRFFNVNPRNITLIYNGIKDFYENEKWAAPTYKKEKIVILYPARVNAVKRQLSIIDNLAGKLSPNIEINFAGVGDDYELLVERCRQSSNFKALGFMDNMDDVIKRADYLMLYSLQEGLPIALIEGIMHGKPLLVNNVGGNLELGIPGYNAIELDEDWDKLAATLNRLESITNQEYGHMSLNSRKNFCENFTYGKMISNYIHFLKKVQSR